MTRRSPEQVAFDSGAGRRSISYLRETPYDAENQPAQYKAWFEGFDRTHEQLGGGSVLIASRDAATDRVEYEVVGWSSGSVLEVATQPSLGPA